MNADKLYRKLKKKHRRHLIADRDGLIWFWHRDDKDWYVLFKDRDGPYLLRSEKTRGWPDGPFRVLMRVTH